MVGQNPFDQFDAPAPPRPQGGGALTPVFEVPEDPVVVQRAQIEAQQAEQNRIKFQERNQPTLPAGYRMGPNGTAERVPGLPEEKRSDTTGVTAKVRADALAGYKAGETLDRLVAEMRAKFAAGPGTTSGIAGLADFLPTDSNDRFDKAANAARGIVGQALGFTGGQLNTEKEADKAVGPYLPQSSDRDVTALDKISQLEALAKDARERAVMILGGIPDAAGRITPVQAANAPDAAARRDDTPAVGVAPDGGGGVPPGAGPAPGTPPIAPVEPMGRQAVAGGASRTVSDPAASALIDRMVRSGASANEINRQLGPSFGSVDQSAVDAARAYLRNNPNYKGSFGDAIRVEDQSLLNQVSGSAIGSAGIAASDTASFGALPKIVAGVDAVAGSVTGAPGTIGERYDAGLANANIGVDASRNAHPVAALAGDVGGFMAGDGLLSAVPGVAKMATRIPGTLRPIVGDALFGATTGVASSDSLAEIPTNVGTKALESVGGGILGRGAMKGVGAALAPAAANVRGLYKAGVRPTPGQRFAERGFMGKALNAVEESAQSLPVVGYAVKGAREAARDQFETGAFNLALDDIGVQLPKTVKYGTDAHGFMQEQFSKAYDDVLPRMKAVADDAFTNETNAIRTEVANGAVTDEAAGRFEKIIADQVDRRMADGVLSGENLKAAVSGLGKRIRDLRSSPSGDRELAAVLEDYSTSLRDAAVRHSAPEDATRLSNIDRGYAKAVRIEEAAAMRGGQPGRFSPTQFDRAVQKTSGGIRSRAYLRGEALLQDYATEGRTLVDRLPNSGTADRLLTTQAIMSGPSAALAYASPGTAAGAALLTAPYLPGVRNVTNGILAPTKSKRIVTLADLLRDNAALGGAVGVVGVPNATAGLLSSNGNP